MNSLLPKRKKYACGIFYLACQNNLVKTKAVMHLYLWDVGLLLAVLFQKTTCFVKVGCVSSFTEDSLLSKLLLGDSLHLKD